MEKRIVGITGGVGSGKSTVLELLRERWQAEIIQADELARELMEPGGSCFRAVVESFGPEILDDGGRIDRGRLAEMVFSDPQMRLRLNALTHPLTVEEARRRIAAASGLAAYESAIPEEARMRELCGEIWYVYVPDEVRIRRLMSSRGYSREKCRRIMSSQLSEAAFRAASDRVIDNSGTTEETAGQLRALLGPCPGESSAERKNS